MAAGQRFQAAGRLAQVLDDEAPRVRMDAAIALGKIGDDRAVDADRRRCSARTPTATPTSATPASWACSARPTPTTCDRLAGDESPSVRLATLLVYRRQGNPEVARFLDDPEPRLVLEAARAINDEAIDGATAKLAALDVNGETPEPVLRRVLNANLRVGTPEAAEAIATDRVATTTCPSRSGSRRSTCSPTGPTPTTSTGSSASTGRSRPDRRVPAADALAADRRRPALGRPRARPPGRGQGDRRPGAPGRRPAPSSASSPTPSGPPRPASRRSGPSKRSRTPGSPRSPGWRPPIARKRSGPRGSASSRASSPIEALPILDAVLQRGTTAERQGALATLGGMKSEQADRLLSGWLDRLLADDVPGEIRLDLIEAAATRSADDLREKLARYEAARPAGDPLAPYRDCLTGGNARRGFQVFFQRTEAQCLRCHKIGGQGGRSARTSPRSARRRTGPTSWRRSSPRTPRSPRGSRRWSSPPSTARS